MSLNRIQAPSSQVIDKAELIRPVSKKLDNGIPYYELRTGSQPVLRLEFIFEAGTKYQEKKLQAAFTNSMLTEGSQKFTALEIAEKTDFYGAFLQPEIENDFASVTLHCLSKSFTNVADVLADIILHPVFPEKELELQLKNARQKYIINTGKVDFLARKKFNESVFGSTHPYGQQADETDYTAITRNDLETFFHENYGLSNLTIIAAGNFDDSLFHTLNKIFGKEKISQKNKLFTPRFDFPVPGKFKTEKPGAIQCGIRVGKISIHKTHPDFQPMQVVNTALGGYFGSRLMANIREDKGYTYGIGSALVSLQDAGYFFIATEAGADVCQNTLKEIYFEINRLQNELIPKDELNMVKNYMLGSFLRNSDGPFAMADRFKSLLFSGLNYYYYDRFIEIIRTISAEEIQQLACKHLEINSLTEVVAGP